MEVEMGAVRVQGSSSYSNGGRSGPATAISAATNPAGGEKGMPWLTGEAAVAAEEAPQQTRRFNRNWRHCRPEVKKYMVHV